LRFTTKLFGYVWCILGLLYLIAFPQDLLRHNPENECKHDIKKDANGNVFVSDATMIAIDPNDSSQLDEIMQLAARHRSVGHTAMNAQSSRSHSIFTLHLKAKNVAEGVVLKGALNLVDLAGSERLDRSGATGARMKETLAINKSLSSLTDVFVAIANKQAHIPYRNSKLTHLLQPCLSGDGKALMMVNLSPTSESYFESLCSLRFASQVNQCELGKPKRFLKEASGGATASAGSKSTLMCSTQSSTGSNAPGLSKSSSMALSSGAKSGSSGVTGIARSSSTVGNSTPGRKIARLK
jgi:hypothetical protein